MQLQPASVLKAVAITYILLMFIPLVVVSFDEWKSMPMAIRAFALPISFAGEFPWAVLIIAFVAYCGVEAHEKSQRKDERRRE